MLEKIYCSLGIGDNNVSTDITLMYAGLHQPTQNVEYINNNGRIRLALFFVHRHYNYHHKV